MCMVSVIGDHFHDKWKPKPWYDPVPEIYKNIQSISRKEFDDLKKEVSELRDLLLKAKEYDERTGQPDCEMESKISILRAVAKAVGIDLDDILKPKA